MKKELFLKEISKTNKELLRKFHESGKKDKDILNCIIKNNELLVKKIARKYYEKCNLKDNIMELTDLEQEGMMGVIVAAEKFDINKGYEFSTYMTFWVKQKVIRSIQNFGDTIRIPAYLKQELSKIGKMTKEGNNSKDKNSKNDYKIEMANMTKITSIDSGIRINNSINNEIDIIEKLDFKKIFPKIKEHLSEREYFVICCRFVECNTLECISDKLNITRERVRQIEVKAIEKLREMNRGDFYDIV